MSSNEIQQNENDLKMPMDIADKIIPPKSIFSRICHWGPITALSIIIFLFICTSLASCVWKHPKNLKGSMNLIVLILWFFLILKNFLKAVSIGPGLLPLKWKPDKGEEKFVQYCKCCKGFKAPRSHHCRACKRCVMKMDHHCPWINNCVGHRNHQSFTLFLIYVIIGCTHATIILILCLMKHVLWENGNIVLRIEIDAIFRMNAGYLIVFFFSIGLSVGVTISVGFLFYHQLKSILSNETGIESWIIEKAFRPGNENYIYPYNLGRWNNFKQVFLLDNNYHGDGISWPLKDGCHKYSFTIEQLLQKQIKKDSMVVYSIVADYKESRLFYKWTFRSCMETPCWDEKLLSLCHGDHVRVSRWKRAWLYGEKLPDKPIIDDDEDLPKGWFPRYSAVELLNTKRQSYMKKLQ